jgi:two-component system, response regulator PdtaR
LVRMTVVDMVEEAGFEVLEATNADEAILLLEARRDITVVFTDIEMPGSMDGLRLAQAVRGRWPPIKIIATSGRYVVRDGDLPPGGVFLKKPYSPAQISSALRDLTAQA